MLSREEAIKALEQRKANRPPHVNNASLYAGSAMHYYCRHCGVESDVLPEEHTERPKRVCDDCQTLIDNKWMPE